MAASLALELLPNTLPYLSTLTPLEAIVKA
jgi:hypothetical protein